MDEGKDAILMLMLDRSFLYSYAARAFSAAPDGAFLEEAAHAAGACSLFAEDGDPSGKSIQKAIEQSACGDGRLETLQGEYTRLFVGPAELPVPPWESVFRSKEPLLFQEGTLAVRKAYLQSGFRATGYPHEADDHVATELNFMAALARRSTEAFEKGDNGACVKDLLAQRAFLEDHLLIWIPEFAERLGEAVGAGSFYPSFASLAALVCAWDSEVLGELLDAMGECGERA